MLFRSEIVDTLSDHPAVAECYAHWNRRRDELERYYKTTPRVHVPLSQQKEFRAIKSMVIREAENIRLGVPSFEDETMDDEPEPHTTHRLGFVYEQAVEYRQNKKVLYDSGASLEHKQAALDSLTALADGGYHVAAHLLGKLYRDGVYVFQDAQQAERWFRVSAEAGNDYSQHSLGKLLLSQKRVAEAVRWLELSATEGYQHSQYALGKLCLCGESVPKNVERSLRHLHDAAAQNNQYAQYTLGKLYLVGKDVPQDKEAAREWFSKSAAQGNKYAQFFLDRQDSWQSPSVLLSATKLLRHMGRIMSENSAPPTNPMGQRIDSNRRKKLMEKRQSMGRQGQIHDEDYIGPNISM